MQSIWIFSLLQPVFTINCSNLVSSSLIDFFFLIRMVRVNYRATTMKSCVDTAIASRCGEVVVSDIDPRHQRRIIAAVIGVGGCEKREVDEERG
jgi:hypothetical protein